MRTLHVHLHGLPRRVLDSLRDTAGLLRHYRSAVDGDDAAEKRARFQELLRKIARGTQSAAENNEYNDLRRELASGDDLLSFAARLGGHDCTGHDGCDCADCSGAHDAHQRIVKTYYGTNINEISGPDRTYYTVWFGGRSGTTKFNTLREAEKEIDRRIAEASSASARR